MAETAALPGKTPLSRRQLGQLVFLGAVTFFDGYDFTAISQLLPNLRPTFGLDQAQAGVLIACINLGAVAACLLARAADRLGRRRLLLLTAAGYTVASFASGLATSAWMFGALQFFGRMFLIADTVVAVVYAAEEFPADRRGLAIGIVQGFFSLGAVACAGVAPLLLRTAWGWRGVYLLGGVSILALIPGRRGLPETRRFIAEARAPGAGAASFWAIWRGPYRRRMLLLSLIWACTFACTQSGVTFWKEFAVAQRGFSDAQVGAAIGIAALAALPLIFCAGALLDRAGRRAGAAVIFGVEVAGALGSYSLHGFWPLTGALVLGIFGSSAVLLVLNTYTAELFPTGQRGGAFAWSNNLLGRAGYVLSPLLVGYVASLTDWGFAVRLTAAGPVLALVLLLAVAPETRARELEDTAKL
jgi:putative MFS transporter